MANTIEQLNFEVILNDKAFNAAIEADLKAARELNTKLSGILNLKKQLNGQTTTQIVNAEKVRQEEQKTAQQVAKTAEAQERVRTQIEKTKNAQKGYADSVFQTKEYLSSTEKIMRTISQLTGVAFSVVGLRRFLESLIEITGHFEVQRMALRNMLQDIDGADKIFEDLYRFSSDSTYRFSELAKYAKQLAAFDIDQNNLLETTKMLGDVASGVGVSMDRLILAYGHVKSSGFLRGIQLRSFSQNGVPILEELSKMFTEVEGKAVSLGDVFDKMTKREIPFEMVEEAFRRMTSEGGKFYQMQEVLAKTLAGQINILKGRWENLLAAIGQSNSGVLKDTVAWMSNLVSSTENVGKLLTEVGVAFGAYKAAVLLATIVTEGFGTVLLNVGIALEKFYLKLMNNPYAIIGAAAAAAGVVIYQYATAVSDADKITQTAEKGIANFNSALVAEQAELDRLYAKLKLAEEGTDEYARAKNEIYNRFGPYIQQLHEEGVAVDNLASIYENLTTKIQESLKAKFLESETSALQKSLDAATNNIYESFKKTAQATGWSIQQQEDIWRYIVTGNLTDKGLEKELKLSGGGTIGLPGTFLYKDFGQSAESLRSLMSEAFGAFNESMGQISDTFKTEASETGETIKNLDKDAKGWRGAVQKAIKDLDASTLKKTGLSPKEDEEYYEYIERVGKRSQELTKERDLALKSEKQEKENLLSAIKTVDKALEGNILKDARYTKTPWNGSSSTDDPNRKERERIKSDIAILEKFKAAYDKLEPIMGENAARAWVFNNMGHDVSKLDEEFEKLIADLEKLGDEGKRDADAIEARLGLDEASKAYKQFVHDKKVTDEAQKSLQKYIDTLQDWADKNQELSGTGAAFDISRDLAKYNKALADADNKAKKSLKNLLYGTTDNTYRMVGYANINAQWMQARANARTTFKNDITKRASNVFKEQLEGFDLTNWNDKTLSQILAIRDAIKNIEIPPKIRKELEGDTEAAAALQQAFNQLKQRTLDNTVDPEMFKKVSKEAKRIAGYLGNAASKMKDFADATGNAKLKDTAEVVGMLAQNMQAAAEGAESWGGWWGAIIGGVTDLFDQATTGLTEAAKTAHELDKSIKEIRSDARLLAQTSLFSDDGIFGVNNEKNISGAVDAMRNLREHMKSLGDPVIKRSLSFWEKVSTGWRIVYNPNHIAQEELPNQGKLTDVMERYGLNVYDQYNNLDPNSIREIIKLFGDEDGVLEQLAKDSEAYAEAMKVVEDVAESLVGGVVEDLADKIVDSWWEAGTAALDYADILEDVAKAYAKLIVNDMLLQAAFDDERQKAFIDALKSGDAATAMGVVEQAMQSAQDMLPAIESALSVFEPYRNMAGTETNSMGAGIKSITEDTANLLASYINAIRADVSFIRLMQEKGWESINALGSSVPTLNEHLAQIAATNFDIAQSNQSILSELQSVIGAPGTSGMVVRVESY